MTRCTFFAPPLAIASPAADFAPPFARYLSAYVSSPDALGCSHAEARTSAPRPRTAQLISTLRSCDGSTRQRVSYASASSTESRSCSSRVTRDTPMLEPSESGLTYTGNGNVATTSRTNASASSSHASRRTSTSSSTRSPAARSAALASRLSMLTADAATPLPAYAMSQSSKSPASVPSSPCVPCTSGNATSMRVTLRALPPNSPRRVPASTSSPRESGSGRRITRVVSASRRCTSR